MKNANENLIPSQLVSHHMLCIQFISPGIRNLVDKWLLLPFLFLSFPFRSVALSQVWLKHQSMKRTCLISQSLENRLEKGAKVEGLTDHPKEKLIGTHDAFHDLFYLFSRACWLIFFEGNKKGEENWKSGIVKERKVISSFTLKEGKNFI